MGAERPLRLGIQLSATLLDVPVAPEALRFAMRDSEACRLRDHVERRLFRDRLTAPDPATRARFHLASLATWQDRLSYCMKTMTLLPGHDGARRRPGFVIGHRLLRPARLALQALNARRRPAAIEADFVSMPMEVVDAVLSFARVAGNDVVFDLGCGDGRVVIRAASTYGASGVGIDLDPRALRRAAEAARRAGVQDRASFHRGDIVRADVAGATVIVMWTTAVLTLRIWPVLQRGCAPGTRVVIVNYVMGTWLADRTQAVTDATGATWKMRLYHAQ